MTERAQKRQRRALKKREEERLPKLHNGRVFAFNNSNSTNEIKMNSKKF
tara:strand:+ start:1220 stop:1366 length:147 start_codon:yes stop_codon:yes gene_type:complete